MIEASLRICHQQRLYKMEWPITLSHPTDHSLHLYTLSSPTIAFNNNNNKHKVEEEAESSTVRKRLRLSDDDGGDDSSGDSEEEMEEEVSSKKSSMNQLNTSEEKLMAKHGQNLFFGDDTSSPESEPRSLETPSSCMSSDPDGSNDDDFWM
jgi:hypothetical protein